MYGVVVLTLLGLKLVASMSHRPHPGTGVPDARVTAVVPFCNEDPEAFHRCLSSLAEQTRAPDRIIVVDDGSSDLRAQVVAWKWAGHLIGLGRRLDVLTFPSNRGKREALAAAFRADPHADLYLCVDSDTVLERNALEEALKPFSDPRVNCVTGLVLAANHRRNLLTRLTELRYANAFLYERAAYSTLGSVLCACGSLAVYRGSVVRANLHDFLTQTFLGAPAVAGDDRRLTNYALADGGRAVLQETAVAYTLVPERLGHFIRQQIRWNKSFFRESLWAVQNLPWQRPGAWLSALELASWVVFTFMLLASLVLHPILTGQVLLLTYSAYVILLGYARSVRYLDAGRPGLPWWERAGVLLLAPLYGALHILLLLPLRLYALCTMRVGGWGTRTEGVEVALGK